MAFVYWRVWEGGLVTGNEGFHRHAAVSGCHGHRAAQGQDALAHAEQAMTKLVIAEQAAAVVTHAHQNRPATTGCR